MHCTRGHPEYEWHTFFEEHRVARVFNEGTWTGAAGLLDVPKHSSLRAFGLVLCACVRENIYMFARKFCWLVVLFFYASTTRWGLSDEPTPSENEFSRAIPISELTDVGNNSPENAARTLIWCLNEARKGVDDVTLNQSVPGLILYHVGEGAKGMIEGPGFKARLYPLQIENPEDVSGVQFAAANTYPNTSDRGVCVRLTYRNGRNEIKTIAFRRYLPGGNRWSARVRVWNDGGELKASFAPPTQR
jgi:hypothetical protein